jgi:hypothetical protein
MAQKLFKVERYEFDFVLAEDAKQARGFEFGDSDPTKTVTEITEMSPEQEGFNTRPGLLWNPCDARSRTWAVETCGEWLKRTEEGRLREKEAEQLVGLALSKLSSVEKAAVLDWASKQPKV